MKYAVRAVKYFFYYWILLALIVGILMALKLVDTDIENVFEHGYNSLWQIAILFAVMGALYPKLGFGKMVLAADGTLAERKSEIISYMNSRFYVLEKQEDGVLVFHRTNPVQRATRMFEDSVTVSQTLEGIELEGLRKDIVILKNGLETKLA